MPRNTDFTKFGEMRMVAEYVSQTYPADLVYIRMRLGSALPDRPVPDMAPEDVAMLGVFRRWADAVVITKRELIVIEASIRSDTGDPSKLLIYGRLVPHTPELNEFRDRKLLLELVVAVADPALRVHVQGAVL